MSLSCLDNLVALDNVLTPVTPTSGIYINKLPGIEIRGLDATRDQERLSAQELYDDIVELSKLELKTSIQATLMGKMRHNSLMDNDTLGYWKDDLQTIASESGQLKGINVKLDNSAYTQLHINSVSLQLQSAVTTDIEIWDLVSGKKLDTVSITTVADQPTEVAIDKTYQTDKQLTNLFIAYDSGVAGAYETTINGKCHGCGDRWISPCRWLSARAGKISKSKTKIADNINSINGGTAGISLDYSVNCSLDRWICQNKQALAIPFMYLIGANVMNEMQYSSRLNTFVTIRNAKNSELQAMYRDKYAQSLAGILDGAQLPNDACFICDKKINKTLQIP